MDVLESGADRLQLLGRARVLVCRRPPRWAVQAVAATLLATVAGGGLAAGSVSGQIAEERRAAAAAAALAAQPDLAARPLGGTVARTGGAATGRLVLEVRNGRQPLRLLGVTAQIPGVRFADVSFAEGRVMSTDDRLEVGLAFFIPECARVERTGDVVLRVASDGVERDLTLAVVGDARTGGARQVNLDLVLDACA